MCEGNNCFSKRHIHRTEKKSERGWYPHTENVRIHPHPLRYVGCNTTVGNISFPDRERGRVKLPALVPLFFVTHDRDLTPLGSWATTPTYLHSLGLNTLIDFEVNKLIIITTIELGKLRENQVVKRNKKNGVLTRRTLVNPLIIQSLPEPEFYFPLFFIIIICSVSLYLTWLSPFFFPWYIYGFFSIFPWTETQDKNLWSTPTHTFSTRLIQP